MDVKGAAGTAGGKKAQILRLVHRNQLLSWEE